MKHRLTIEPADTVHITVESSTVWEVMLGIAGYTYAQIRHTFDLNEQWGDWGKVMNQELRDGLDEIQKTNLWYGMLLLQNKLKANSIPEFSNGMEMMSEATFYEVLLPYKNREAERMRIETSQHFEEKERFERYAAYFRGHEYFEGYIQILGKRSSESIREIMICVIEEWHSFVSKQLSWDKWRQALAFEQKENQSIDEHKPLEEIQRITGGATYTPEPSVWNVKLVPHVSYRPWLLELRTADTKIFFYPVKEDYLMEPGIPSVELVRGHKALGDELRLKLLYQLQKGPQSLQELSGQFQISKTTLHHQLSLLKAAKFVMAEKGVYHANIHHIKAFSKKLMQYLGSEG